MPETIEHLKWEKHGHQFIVKDDQGNPIPNRHVWQSVLGECNVLHNGEYHPYRWDGDNCHVGDDQETEFASGYQVLKKAGKIIANKSKIFVEAKLGQNWVTQPHGIPTRSIRHNQIFDVEGGWLDRPGKYTAWLNFPDAHLSFGAQDPYDFQVGIMGGRGYHSTIGMRLRSPVSGTVRLQWVIEDIEKLPTDWEWIIKERPGGSTQRVGVRFKDFIWKWTPQEDAYRDISVETQPDGKKKATITLGPYDITANEWLFIYPDTWGSTAIAANVDDGMERVETDVWYTDYINVGHEIARDYTYHAGLSWAVNDEILADSTINKCYIRLSCSDTADGGAESPEFSCRMEDNDPASATIFAQGRCPENDALSWIATPASLNFSQSAGNWYLGENDNNPYNWNAQLEAIVATGKYGTFNSGDRLNFCLYTTLDTENDWVAYDDYNDSLDTPELYLDWTEPAAASIPLLVANSLGGNMLGGNCNLM